MSATVIMRSMMIFPKNVARFGLDTMAVYNHQLTHRSLCRHSKPEFNDGLLRVVIGFLRQLLQLPDVAPALPQQRTQCQFPRTSDLRLQESQLF